jgi:hypothetical protein
MVQQVSRQSPCLQIHQLGKLHTQARKRECLPGRPPAGGLNSETRARARRVERERNPTRFPQ